MSFPLYRVVQDAVGCINTLREPCGEEELDDLGVRDDLEEANRLVNSTCSEEGDWDISLHKRAHMSTDMIMAWQGHAFRITGPL